MVGTYSGSYAIANDATYGPGGARTTTLNGNLYVNSDATLQNLVVNGTIFVNPGQNGDVTLNNVTATNIVILSGGTSIVILSGGTSSIILNNVDVSNLLTIKDDDSLRVETRGTTAIAKTLVQSGAILEVAVGTSSSFGTIELAPTTSAPIELKGHFGTSPISISAPNTVLNVATGSQVGTLTVNAAATGTTVDNAGIITAVTANEDVVITGTGPESTEGTGNVEINGTVEIDGTNLLTVTANTASKFSVNTKLPIDLTISQIESLSISLLDANDAILTTNTLNALGHFLHGTEANTFDEKFKKKLVAGNVATWKGYYDKITSESKPTYTVWEAGLEILHPSVGDASNIDTSFIARSVDLDGTTNLTSTSAWNQGKFEFIKPSKVLVEYVKDGVTYKAVKDVQ